MESLKYLLEKHIGKIALIEPCRGGDINKSFCVETDSAKKYFLKCNSIKLKNMFEAEQTGLSLLRNRSNFRVPKVLDLLASETESGLLMEWIEPSQPDSLSWQKFWTCLGELHDIKEEKFGLPLDNYIGSLPQQNYEDYNWIEFWIERRISPLMIAANEKGIIKTHEIPSFLMLFDYVRRRFADYEFEPCLLHGDLWNGNLIFDENGHPTLLDPAVYFGWPEMELAFMDLFGGFSSAGREFYKPQVQSKFLGSDLYMIWQIYPLLVHTILLGGTYKRRLMTAVTHALEL